MLQLLRLIANAAGDGDDSMGIVDGLWRLEGHLGQGNVAEVGGEASCLSEVYLGVDCGCGRRMRWIWSW